MSRTAQLLSLLAVAAAVTGCTQAPVKPDLPPATVIKPQIVYVDRYVYVPIKEPLTDPHSIAEGPLAECPAVAAARKAELVKCNAAKREIRAIEGTPLGKGDR